MDRQRIKNGSAWVLSVLLTLAFTIAALPKLLGAQVWVAKFVRWGYPNWFPFAIGSLELLGAILLLLGTTVWLRRPEKVNPGEAV